MSIGLRLSLAVLFLVLGKINLRTSPDRATTRWFYNPCLSSGFLCCVMLMDRVTARTILVYSGVFTFLVDAYPTFAASALAANSFTRSSFGGIFPLFGMQSKCPRSFHAGTRVGSPCFACSASFQCGSMRCILNRPICSSSSMLDSYILACTQVGT